jgi:hypothetical protein
VKKIFSLIIALTLLVSVFALSAVAFADAEARTVTVTDLGNAYLFDKVGTDRFIADQENFKGWLTTTADVKSVFTGINFAMLGDADYDKDAKYDTVRLEYCTGDPRFQDNWVSDEKTLIVAVGGTNFNLKLSGYVAFRYSATYKPTPDAEEKTVVTKEFVLFVEDTTAPVLELGTTLSSKVAEGLTVGKAYTITTSSSSVKVTDSSTYTTTYAIQKLINGQYVEIYNSVDGLSEDYEGKDVAGGTITPSAEDVLDKATYKVIFSATDANGFKGNDLVVEFKVNAKAGDVEEEKKVDVLKIVLYIVAGLSAAGIVVLLLIKPKKEEPTRIVYTETPNDSDNK